MTENWIETLHSPIDAQVSVSDIRGAICLDLDGTLIYTDQTIHPRDCAHLKRLANNNWIRVIATGRSLESFRRAIPDISNAPIDYLVFSSGVGIVRIFDQRLLRTVNLTSSAVEEILRVVVGLDLDFMIHHPAPDNVRFSWWCSPDHAIDRTDFHARVFLYEGLHTPLIHQPERWDTESAQIICIVPPGNPEPIIETIRTQLPNYNVVRTTSPLDKQSTWIEIYPGIVSKGQTCDWLIHQIASPQSGKIPTIAIGNDFNDLDMLNWAENSFVVSDAPIELRNRFTEIPSLASTDDGILNYCLNRGVFR